MIANKFCFHPVGQGLFYSGILNDGQYCFVYDCGTENNRSFIEREIKELKAELSQKQRKDKPQLDFVVISHLHEDHINGLEMLQNEFTIKKIILPYLNPQPDVIDLIVANAVFTGNESVETEVERYNIIRSYYGDAYATDARQARDETILFPREKVAGYGGEELYLEKIAPVNIEWEFVFVNKTFDANKMHLFNQKLQTALRDLGLGSVRQLVDWFSRGQNYKEIKSTLHKVYEKTFGTKKINETSTVVMHYPIIDLGEPVVSAETYATTLNAGEYNKGFVNCGGEISLLTGDTIMDNIMLNRLTHCHAEPFSGIVQIPHHGSKDNYFGIKGITCLPDLWNNFAIQVIPYGMGNKHHHPQQDVLLDIQQKGKNLLSATQNLGVRYKIDVLDCDDEDPTDIRQEHLTDTNAG